MNLSNELMDKPSFLLAIEQAYIGCECSQGKDSTPSAEFVSTASLICYKQGLYAAKEKYGIPIHQAVVPDTALILGGIKAGQERWDLVMQYMKDTYGMELHKLAYLAILRGLSDETSSREYDICFAEAIHKYLDEITEELSEDIKSATKVPENIPEIPYDPTKDHLIDDIFDCLAKLKTFRRDPSQYKTDEERVLHNKILGMYKVLNDEIRKDTGEQNG